LRADKVEVVLGGGHGEEFVAVVVFEHGAGNRHGESAATFGVIVPVLVVREVGGIDAHPDECGGDIAHFQALHLRLGKVGGGGQCGWA